MNAKEYQNLLNRFTKVVVPNCNFCRVECPYAYSDGCMGLPEENCQYFIPKGDHILYKNEWYPYQKEE